MTLTRMAPESIAEFIANWLEHLVEYHRTLGVPLSYIIWVEEEVPPEACDPVFGNANMVYDSTKHEMVACAPHDGETYNLDNAKVWTLFWAAVVEHWNVFNWIVAFAHAQNGRAAWLAFIGHYCGTSEIKNIITTAHAHDLELKYTGENPWFTFENYASLHPQ